MKRYNIDPAPHTFPWCEMPVLALGEKGRGRWRHYAVVPYHAPADAPFLSTARTRSGKPKIVRGRGPEDRWLARICCRGVYTRRTHGDAWVLEKDRDRIGVVAAGCGAYGDAGGAGEWFDFLLIIPDQTWLYVKPSGLHKTRGYWLWFDTDAVTRVEREELPAFCAQHSILNPLAQPPTKINYRLGYSYDAGPPSTVNLGQWSWLHDKMKEANYAY